jgi:putative oxidoreductase
MRQTLVEAQVSFPGFNAVFVSAVEFACGLLLVLGALTPLASPMLGCVMIVATCDHCRSQHQSVSSLDWLAEFLYLPEVLYLVILIWLFFSGPGWLSVDHLVLSQTRLWLAVR